MRAFAKGVLLATLFVSSVARADSDYRVVAELPAGDGGWDLASVDPTAQRLYVARTDGVTMIDLRPARRQTVSSQDSGSMRH